MRLFSEEVTPTFTNSNLNILTVKDFNEVFFDVYELEINGKKYVTEKVSEYKGSPVINIQLTHKGNEYTAPCVLNKGQFNFLVNEQTFQYVGKSQEIDDSLFEQPTVDEVEEIVFEKHESILEDIQNAKRSAQEYLIKVKEQHEAELAKSHIKNSKKIKRELESIRNDLVEEFLQIATNNYSDLHKSNEELKSYILENVNKIVSSLEKDVKTKSETLEISLEERFNEFARDITNGVLAKEIKESRQVVIDNINSVLNAVDDKLTTIDKANIELNDAITKTSNKALSRIGNVKVQLQEEIAKNVEIIQHDISKSIDKIKTIYDNRIKILSEDNSKLNEDTKKECIKLVTESRDSLLSVINDIKVEVPNIIIEKEGKPFKEIDIKKVKAELEKNITSRFTSEMASIKRMIELMSGGGSVAQQFANGGVMNGNLTVVGAISASQYLGIPGGGGVSGDYLPLSGGTVNGNTIINSDVGKTFGFVGSFTGEADVTLLQTKTSPFIYSSDGENTQAATGAWYGVFIDEGEPFWRLQYYFNGLESVGTWYSGGSGPEPESGTWMPSGATEGDVTVTINTYQNTLEVNNVTGITLNSSDPNSGFVSISGNNNVTIAGGTLNFNSSGFAYASGGADLHRTALGLGTTDSPTFSAINSPTVKLNDDSYFALSTEVRGWYLTGKSYLTNIPSAEATPQGVFFSPSGEKMFYVGSTTDTVREFNLSTPWDLDTVTYVQNFAVGTQDSVPTNMYISPDGGTMLIVGDNNNRVYQYNLPNAWSLTSASYANKFTNIGSQEINVTGVYCSHDGLYMYVVGSNSDSVHQYELGSPFDLTSVTYLRSRSIAAQDITPASISFNNDGTRMYVLGVVGRDINEYRLTTAWDISTASYFSTGFTSLTETGYTGLYFNEDAQRCYVVGTTTDTIVELATDAQTKYFGDSFIMDSQFYVGGRAEFGGEVTSNGTFTNFGTTDLRTTTTIRGNATFTSDITHTGATTTLGNTLNNSTIALGNGATLYGNTKTVNLGTGGAAGSTTNITVGSLNNTTLTNLTDTNIFRGDLSIGKDLKVLNSYNGSKINETASGTLAFYDTFDEVSDTLLDAHTPNTGSSWTRYQTDTATPTIQVVGGAGYASPPASVTDDGVIYIANPSVVENDYEITLDFINAIPIGTTTAYIVFRFTDIDNFYALRLSRTTGATELWGRVGGVAAQINSDLFLPSSSVRTVTVRAVGNIVTVLYDGAVQITHAITSFLTGGFGIGVGNIGIYTADDTSTAWDFDAFTVRYYDPVNDVYDSYFEKGNVGIGTTTPTEKLTVAGNTLTTGVLLGGSTASFPYIKRNESGIDIRDAADSSFTDLRAANITLSGGDIEVVDNINGVILKSPDGTRFRITVTNSGALSTTAV